MKLASRRDRELHLLCASADVSAADARGGAVAARQRRNLVHPRTIAVVACRQFVVPPRLDCAWSVRYHL